MNTNEKLEKIFNLSKEIGQLKQEKKDTAAGYRDSIKQLQNEIDDLIAEVEEEKKKTEVQ